MTNLRNLVQTLMNECVLEWDDDCTCKRCVTIKAIHAEMGKPAAEPSRDAEDAARYRWLREGSLANVPQVYADDDCNTWLHGDELDKAVDAARAFQNPLARAREILKGHPLATDSLGEMVEPKAEPDFRALLAEIVTPLLEHYANEQEKQGSERVPCFLQIEYIRRALSALNRT